MKINSWFDRRVMTARVWRFCILREDVFFCQGVKRLFWRFGWVRRDVELQTRIKR